VLAPYAQSYTLQRTKFNYYAFVHKLSFNVGIIAVKCLLVALFFLLPIIANAACWEELAEADDRKIFIDVCSIVNESGYKKIWFKEELKLYKNLKDSYYDSTKNLSYFDCGKNITFVTQQEFYNKDELVFSEKYNPKNTKEEIIPDSIGEEMLKAACGKRNTKYKKHQINREEIISNKLNKSNECWKRDFSVGNTYTTDVNVCSIRIDTKANTYKTYIRFNYFLTQKFLSFSADKEYYNTHTTELNFDCKSNIDFFNNTNYYLDGVFVASSTFPTGFVDTSKDINQNIINKTNSILCPYISKIIKSQEKILGIDKIPDNFCWQDIFVNKSIGFYFDRCTVIKENKLKRKAWFKTVYLDKKPSENTKNVFYDKVISQKHLNCSNKKLSEIQTYSYSPNNIIVEKDITPLEKYTYYASIAESEPYKKMFSLVCSQ